MKIKIGDKLVGENKPVFVIAEAGVNHNGRLDLALKLIDAAKNAGADAVKFQTFRAEELVTSKASMAIYQKRNTGKSISQQSMLKKLELSHENFRNIKSYCTKKKIIFLSTPHTESAADFLKPFVPAYKIGSGDLTNIPLLEKIAKYKKPIILSTGMATLIEVKNAVHVIKKVQNNKIILLHCTSNYPCLPEEVNLMAMKTIGRETECMFGYSDHTQSIEVPMIAAAMGAVLIEKHFTLDKSLEGPDHKASLEPSELKKMVESIKNVKIILGNGIKKPTASEEKIKKIARKSIVAKIFIPKNTQITEKMLIIKRPGTGIEPGRLNNIIGKVSWENIKEDTLIKYKSLK